MNKDGYENNNNGFTKPKSIRDIFFQFWRLVIRRKWTILFFLIIVTTTATIFTFSTPPIFVSKGTLLIEKEPNILTFEEIYQIEPLKDDFLLTQINLLYSRKVANRWSISFWINSASVMWKIQDWLMSTSNPMSPSWVPKL